jgi:hypothetical protein
MVISLGKKGCWGLSPQFIGLLLAQPNLIKITWEGNSCFAGSGVTETSPVGESAFSPLPGSKG